MKNKRRRSLYETVTSDENIFNAIYALDSYVFEKGLLEDKDIELMNKLQDKYDFQFIGEVISRCKTKLKAILADPNEIFSVKVYFKMKKFEEGHMKYRPIHTASLIDQICMVALLLPLLFDDSSGKRKLSELSKLIPHNFYGNIPDTNVSRLFKKWNIKYKEYSDAVLEHCRIYQKSHKYLTVVTLDIKNFFPSINPIFLLEYIISKLSSAFPDSEDKKTLTKIVTKLLFFNIPEDNLIGWEKDYYGKYVDLSKGCMSMGIPQGLPQSYLFGNLCMIEIKKEMEKKDLFPGDNYYYVDDSVLYLNYEINEIEDFDAKISNLNNRIKERFKIGEVKCYKPLLEVSGEKIISDQYFEFHKRIDYQILFHENEKSSFVPIDEAENHFGGIENLAREIYGGASIYQNIDEIEDDISYKKLMAIDEVITKELNKIKRHIDKIEISSGEEDFKKQKFESRLKFLKRYKRFFLWRQRMMQIKAEGCVTEEIINRFKKNNHFEILDESGLHEQQSIEGYEDKIRQDWLDRSDEDIFRSEYSILIRCSNFEKAEEIQKKIRDFECWMTNKDDYKFLYYSKDGESNLKLRKFTSDKYASIAKWLRVYFNDAKAIRKQSVVQEFKEYSEQVLRKIEDYGFPRYSIFVFENSEDYKRQILNSLFSYMVDVPISDAATFVKNSPRSLCYFELRILAMLRNRWFETETFNDFLSKISRRDLVDNMTIDMGLIEVLALFIQKVGNPAMVDSLIQTHRLVKGLWQNGSKFLYAYTLHNEEHAVTLIKQTVHLEKTIDYFNIKREDFYILFLACYLHDISMVVHPNIDQIDVDKAKIRELVSNFLLELKEKEKKLFPQETAINNCNSHLKEAGKFMIEIFQNVYNYFEGVIRDTHPRSSADFIRNNSDTFLSFIPKSILSFVAETAESHGEESQEIYGEKSKAKNDLISRKYLKILIRLADLMDISNDRINYYLLRQNGANLSRKSRFHWISHLITESIYLNARYSVADGKGLREKPITECLDFNICLNTKYLSSLGKKDACINCNCLFPCEKEIAENEDYDALDGVTLHIGKPCKRDECLFICRWVMKKHGWLVNELKELLDYLQTVNNTLISTQIRINIFFSDTYKLDPDLFDSISEEIETD